MRHFGTDAAGVEESVLLCTTKAKRCTQLHTEGARGGSWSVCARDFYGSSASSSVVSICVRECVGGW